jgi:hypothetical protein
LVEMTGWDEIAARAVRRHDDGLSRLPDEPDERQRQLTRMGNAAWAAGLSYLMLARRDESRAWLLRAAEHYRESWPLAPPDSWGRPLGAMKSRLLADDLEGVRADAEWALEAGAEDAAGPIGRYAAVLARLVRGEDGVAARLVSALRVGDDFPVPVADSLAALASSDTAGYDGAIRALLADFERRDEFLEDVPVADTVLVLQALARRRGLEVALDSELLPPTTIESQ